MNTTSNQNSDFCDNTKNSKSLVQWTIRGANWVWKKYDQPQADPLELATQALESFWNKASEAMAKEEAWKITEPIQLELPQSGPPSLGMVVSAEHNRMTEPTEKILVCSVTALSNAGFHNDASRLVQAWERDKSGNNNKDSSTDTSSNAT